MFGIHGCAILAVSTVRWDLIPLCHKVTDPSWTQPIDPGGSSLTLKAAACPIRLFKPTAKIGALPNWTRDIDTMQGMPRK